MQALDLVRPLRDRLATPFGPQTGFLERSYDQPQEAEAYDLGVAILLP